jgi:RimJ/RimL family protein N-acetyltransferase
VDVLDEVSAPKFREADVARELDELAAFLCRHEWPFHGRRRLTVEQARELPFGLPTTRTFWIDVDGGHVGLLRLQDVDDIGRGQPLFDLRLAPDFRGRGIGRRAVEWLIELVFREYPDAHRIEATTRFDNVAMRRVLEACGFQLEGRLRETWPDETGARFDTAIYGLLRRDVAP